MLQMATCLNYSGICAPVRLLGNIASVRKEVHSSIIELDLLKKKGILGKKKTTNVQIEEQLCIQTAATRVLAENSHLLCTPL